MLKCQREISTRIQSPWKKTMIKTSKGDGLRRNIRDFWRVRLEFCYEIALEIYGKNWKKVEAHVKTRTGTQIRSHAQKYFNKLKSQNIPIPSSAESPVVQSLPEIDVQSEEQKNETATQIEKLEKFTESLFHKLASVNKYAEVFRANLLTLHEEFKVLLNEITPILPQVFKGKNQCHDK
jgi:SHAQKYF class myb-like DNA-binding protein